MAREIRTDLTANPSGFVRGVTVARGSLTGLQKQLTDFQSVAAQGFSFAGLAGLPLSATAAAAAVAALVKTTADYGDKIDNLSQRTGIAAEDISRLTYIAQMSDTSMEAVGKGVANLSNLLVAAGSGAEESGKLFARYGVAVRNTDGSMRSALDVLYNLADIFASLPDGPEKTALATEFFGKKLGQELIPLLNQGSVGLRQLGDEAERLGLVLSSQQAKAAAEFNDNLDQLSSSARGAAISIGNELLPVISEYLSKFNAANAAGLTIWERLGIALDDDEDPAEMIKSLTADLDALQAKLAAGNQTARAQGMIREEIASIERRLEYYRAGEKQIEAEQAKSASNRETLQRTLANKLASLEQMRLIVSGKASADILKSDKELNDARIKDAERLRDALRSAYETSAREAKSAADEAVRLLDQARAKRTGAADKALDARTAGMSSADRAAAYRSEAETAFSSGRFYAAAAASAGIDGRIEQMRKYQKQAEEALNRAEALADKSGNSNLIQGVAEEQARLLEQQAKAKQKEAADLQQRATDQLATLNDVEQRVTALVTQGATLEIKGNMTQLEADIARIRAELAAGATLPVTAVLDGGGQPSPAPGFSSGGFTGWGGTKSISGFVHGQEYVTPANVTLQPGVLPFLEALRRHGNKVLPGYEQGGLVSNLSLPSVPGPAPAAPSRQPMVLDFGKLGRYQVEATTSVTDSLAQAFRRASLARGKR